MNSWSVGDVTWERLRTTGWRYGVIKRKIHLDTVLLPSWIRQSCFITAFTIQQSTPDISPFDPTLIKQPSHTDPGGGGTWSFGIIRVLVSYEQYMGTVMPAGLACCCPSASVHVSIHNKDRVSAAGGVMLVTTLLATTPWEPVNISIIHHEEWWSPVLPLCPPTA